MLPSEEHGELEIPSKVELLISTIAFGKEQLSDCIIGYFVNPVEKDISWDIANFKGDYITRDDVKIAKNYLSERELQVLNLLVSQYLDFAELQAIEQQAMTMQQWIEKLACYLSVTCSEFHAFQLIDSERNNQKHRFVSKSLPIAPPFLYSISCCLVDYIFV